MRTDVKIGIGMGVLVVVLAVVYFLVVGGKEAPRPETPVVRNEPTRLGRPVLYNPPANVSQQPAQAPSGGPAAVVAGGWPQRQVDDAPATRPAQQIDYDAMIQSLRAGQPGQPADRPGQASAAPAATDTYTIKSGDTLSSIAQQFYGDANKYQLLVDANPGINPNRLQLNQKIKIPPASAALSSASRSPSSPAATSAGPNSYVIKRGDTFSSIAQDKFGSTRHADLIAAANPGVDPNRLRIGQVIALPAAAVSAATTRPAAVASRGPSADTSSAQRDPRRPWFGNR